MIHVLVIHVIQTPYVTVLTGSYVRVQKATLATDIPVQVTWFTMHTSFNMGATIHLPGGGEKWSILNKYFQTKFL